MDATLTIPAADTPGATDAGAPAAPGPQRNRARRLRLFIAALGLVGGLAVVSLGQNWYVAYIPPARLADVEGVTAAATLTGWDLAHLGAQRPDPAAVGPGAANPAVPTTAGIPSCVFWLLATLAMAAAGAKLRSGLVAGVGLAGLGFVGQNLAAIRTGFENPLTLGEAVLTSGPGQALFGWAYTAGAVLAVLTCVQIVAVNAAERRDARRQALAEGREPPPSVFETVRQVVAGEAARVLRNPAMAGRTAEHGRDAA